LAGATPGYLMPRHRGKVRAWLRPQRNPRRRGASILVIAREVPARAPFNVEP